MPTFTFATDPPAHLPVDVLVLPVFEGPQAGPGLKEVRALDLLGLFAATGAKGKRGESLLVPNPGVKGLAANATYHVFLIQGNADCDTEDGTITTNGKGNGNGHFSEPSASSHALVFLYRDVPGGDSYATETYTH